MGGPNRRDGRRDNRSRDGDERDRLEERVFGIRRVAKVQQGGRRFSFTAAIVVGDRAGRVGFATGKAKEVPIAIEKARARATRDMRRIPMMGATIPHEVLGRDGAGKVLLKPAAPGTGVVAGLVPRAILECLGVEDCLTKILGTTNEINVARATLAGLYSLRLPTDVARVRNRSVEEVASPVMLARMNTRSPGAEAASDTPGG